MDNSAQGAIYKGLRSLNDRLYATDFHNGRVDSSTRRSSRVPLAAFKDPKIPAGWAPFGIQALGGTIFVTYAKQDKAKKETSPAAGSGYVDEFSPDGVLLARRVEGEAGAAERPVGARDGAGQLRRYSGDLLVGNFGNGRISAYQQPHEPTSGSTRASARRERHADRDRRPLGDRVRQRRLGRPTNDLYFAAGPAGEQHGLFGFIAVG